MESIHTTLHVPEPRLLDLSEIGFDSVAAGNDISMAGQQPCRIQLAHTMQDFEMANPPGEFAEIEPAGFYADDSDSESR